MVKGSQEENDRNPKHQTWVPRENTRFFGVCFRVKPGKPGFIFGESTR